MRKLKNAISNGVTLSTLAIALGALVVGTPLRSSANRLLLNGPFQNGSLGDSEQMNRLNANIMQLVESNAIALSNARAVATALNRELRKVNPELPEVNVEARGLTVTPALRIGFANSDTIGFEITDGTHRYCLPCTVTRNSFERGITRAGQTRAPGPQAQTSPPPPSPGDALPRDAQGDDARTLLRCGTSSGPRVEVLRRLSSVGPRFQFDVSNRGRELFFNWVSAQLERQDDNTCVINFRSHRGPGFPVDAVYDPTRNEFENRLAGTGEPRSVACGGPNEVDAIFRERVRRCDRGTLGLIQHDAPFQRMSLPAGGGVAPGGAEGTGVQI